MSSSLVRLVVLPCGALRASPGRMLKGTALILATVAGSTVVAGEHAAVEAREYSAFSDPDKPVLSVLLADPGNADSFEREFGLGDREMGRILAAVRRENRVLAREYRQSEALIRANSGLSKAGIRRKLDASDYEEEVEAVLARTKARAKAVVPGDGNPGLAGWVDERWRRAVAEYEANPSGYEFSATGRGVRYRVFATQYEGYTRFEVALPHRKLKFDGGYKVRLRRGERAVLAPVKEVGPWNTYDNYWQARKYRTMWKDLRRGVNQSRAAYFRNYNNGEDEYGRKVLNPAGVDLTPAVAARLGLKKYQNAWIYVRFPWVRK